MDCENRLSVPRGRRAKAFPATVVWLLVAAGAATAGPPSNPWPDAAELELAALVTKALERNPSLAAMDAASRAARTGPRQAASLDDPELGFGFAPATIGSELDFGQEVSLSQRLPWPGTLDARADAARADSDAADGDLAAARLSLVEAAGAAYFDLYLARRALEINETNLLLLAEVRDVAESRYAAGLAGKQDALEATLAYQELVHRRIVLERRNAVARARVNTLLDLPPRSPLPPPPPSLAVPATLPDPNRLFAEAAARRPELLALARRVEAHEARIRGATLDFFPALTLRGSYSSLWQEEDLRPMIGFGIELPVRLDRRRAALEEARARRDRAKRRLDARRAAIFFEVDQAFEELREGIHGARLYESTIVPAADESLASARSGYETGTNDFRTLVEAERSLTRARLAYEKTLAGAHAAKARLAAAVGLGPEDSLEDLR